jgi:hypothetical protein
MLATQGALLVVQAEDEAADEAAGRAMLAADPWYAQQILTVPRIVPWQIFIDESRL